MRAFVRSLIWWQRATVTSAGHPTPVALLAIGDLDEAAVDLREAKKWVAWVERAVKGHETCIADAVAAGHDGHPEVEKVRRVLEDIRVSHRYAIEHVESFRRSSATRRA